MSFFTRSAHSNIRKILANRVISSCWFITPVMVPFYQSFGLTATEMFAIQAIFNTAMCLLEIPTGYLSDIIGRRKTLIICSLFLPLGCLIYGLSSSLAFFIIAELLLALALSLMSGTETSMLYDSLVEIDQEPSHKRTEGLGYFLSNVSQSLSSLAGGAMSLVSLRLPFFANAAVMMLLLPLYLSLKEPKRERIHHTTIKAHLQELIGAIRYCLHHKEIRLIIPYAGIVTSTGIASLWGYYIYYGNIGIAVALFGVLSATSALTRGTGGKLAHALEKRLGLWRSLCIPMAMPFGFLAISAFSDGFWGLPFIFLNAYAWGTAMPLFSDLIHKRAKTSIRATVMSAMTMWGRLCLVVTGLMVGRMIDLYSLQAAYLALAFAFLPIGLLSLAGLRKKLG